MAEAALDQARKKLAAYEEETIPSLEAALEQAVLDNEDAQQMVDVLKLQLHDQQLKSQAELLAKELQLASFGQLQDEMDTAHKQKSKTSNETQSLLDSIQELQSAFETLKKWHVETAEKLRATEERLNSTSSSENYAMSELAGCQQSLAEKEKVILGLEAAVKADSELLALSETVHQELRERNTRMSSELALFEEALKKVSGALSHKDSQHKQQIAELTSELADVRKEMSKCKNFLAPRWKRLAQEHKENKGSVPSAKLQGAADRVSRDATELQLEFMTAAVPTEAWKDETEQMKTLAQVHRCLFTSLHLLSYYDEAHFSELVADASDNEASVGKDKPFVRWLQECANACSIIAFSAGQLHSAVRKMSPSQYEAMLKDSALTSIMEFGEAELGKILSASCNDALSSNLDIGGVSSFGEKLQQFLREKFPREQDETPSVAISAILYRLAAFAALGSCRAAYTDKANQAVKAQKWQEVYSACSVAIETIPPTQSSTCATRGFSCLVAQDTRHASPSQVLEELFRVVAAFEGVLCDVDESKTAESQSVLIGAVDSLLGILAAFEKQTLVFAYSKANANWKVAAEAVLHKLSDVTEIEKQLSNVKERCTEKETTIDSLQKRLDSSEKAVGELKLDQSELRRRAERCAVKEAEVKELRNNAQELLSTFKEAEAKSLHFQGLKDSLESENTKLLLQLGEMRKSLEASRKVSKHHVVGTDSQEISNLLAIVHKLENELLANQLRSAKDLDNRDLKKYISALGAGPTRTDLAAEAGINSEADLRRASRLVEEYNSLQQAVWLHAFRVPFWDPSQTTGDTNDYVSQHQALKVKIRGLRAEVGQALRAKLECGVGKSFGDQPAPPAARYVRAFTDMGSLQSPVARPQPQPFAVLQLPCALAPHDPTLPQKLVLSEDQLGVLHKEIVGISH